MSAGAQDQRKNQLPQGNAPKEGGVAAEPEASFDAWRPQQQQPSYSTAMTGMASADPYMSSYYGGAGGYPPYQAFGVGDGAWSNGGDHLAFMGGYSQPTVQADSYMDGMFGGQGFGGFGQPGFNYGPFHGNGDYSGWGGGGGGAAGRKYDDYYRGDPATYGADERAVKQVEQGMQRLSVDAGKHDPRIYGDLAPAGGPQKKSWASVASQPARAVPLASKMVMPLSVGGRDSIGMWDGKNGGLKPVGPPAAAAGAPPRPGWMAPRGRGAPLLGYPPHQAPPPHQPAPPPAHPVLDELRDRNEYNPKEFDVNPKNARFFVIKSYSEDDIHRAIKYEIWCSTEHGNKRLDAAFRERDGKGPVYLLFSVNGSGHFCGMAQMLSSLDYNASSSVWAQDKWKGQFKVKWVYVKDVPNSQLRHIRLENNENKPVTNSRDTQEVPPDKGRQVLKIIHGYGHRTSIFDDFVHYEQRQEEEEGRKPHPHSVKSSPHEEDDHTSGRGERDRGRGPRN